MPKNAFKAGEALTAEKMNTLLQEDRLVYGSEESGNDYVSIMTKKAVEDKLDKKYTKSAGAINTSDLANEAVETAKIKDYAVTESKIADGAITPEKFSQREIYVFNKSFEQETDRKNKEIFVALPETNEHIESKFMVFLYYGTDKGNDRSTNGVHLLRAFFVYSKKGESGWQTLDTDTHSWSAYGDRNNSDGKLQACISGNNLKISVVQYDNLTNDSHYFVQGWQI